MVEANGRRVWFITGAATGLGRTLAEEVLGRDECVAATARRPSRLADLEATYRGNVLAAGLDVKWPAEARAAMDAAISEFGHVDVVVNNAGFGLFGALEELPNEELRREFDTNVFGAIAVLRAALPRLREQRSGHIVQISSLEGISPEVAGETAYAATKFACEGIAEALDKEVSDLGIRVTIVEPGPVRTNFGDGASITPPRDSDYAGTVGEALDWFAELEGQQPNDPERVARAIVEAVDADEPPLRLALGDEAVSAIRAKLERQARDLDAWEHLSGSTSFAA
jgi:NAD(P)-dependent dehydrogenase (short-subunit alcohol dehydrogenase family)